MYKYDQEETTKDFDSYESAVEFSKKNHGHVYGPFYGFHNERIYTVIYKPEN